MRTAKCPECGERVRVSSAVEVGDEISCPSCGEELEVTETEPLSLGFLGSYEEDELEEDEEFDEDLEEDDEFDEDSDDEDDDSF
jgi:lysine biosynthesis protein LysW